MFDQFFVMKAEDAVRYVKEKGFFTNDARLEAKEIGDGNINFVFRVRDTESGKSLIIKQGGEMARISDEFKLSSDRVRIEYEMLTFYNERVPDLVPEVLAYDDRMHCFVSEDLGSLTIMRDALLARRRLPHFAEHITTFLVETLFYTTDIAMDPKEKKRWVGKFINPDLCEITEDLVYTEPYTDYRHRNDLFEPNRAWIERMFYEDKALRREVAQLKWQFMTEAQALIHGDLHTGSIFVDEQTTKVIDPEFAFYGPIGYDVGNVLANLMFAWGRFAYAPSVAPKENVTEVKDYVAWLEETIVQVADRLIEKFLQAWAKDARDPLARDKEVAEAYVRRVMADSAGVCGLELARRIIGLAHVKDIVTIPDDEERKKVERILLRAAKHFIFERHSLTSGADFIQILKTAEMEEEQDESGA
ncbi:MAG: 5-methylthioribose kinase [Candidatus Carbobacillus altaicus]|uniref:S-methyl-5-thioribose kinase n=1 Tax=Candidatus Carbonibacillus altaicus TaxID=2163959 RepID=A0A2R6XYT8_9BACL|nr:MAG: 5-methylthioribose kinase [Candidatus Carbobacillus altaicus]